MDFGAGTGRVAIPLKKEGYEVFAVDISTGMLRELERKCEIENIQIPTYETIPSETKDKIDLTIALFTVLSYITTEKDLNDYIKLISQQLKPEGLFLFDLPQDIFFQENHNLGIQRTNLSRQIFLTKLKEEGVFQYQETCSGVFKGKEFSYTDQFPIKYWTLKAVDEILEENQLIDTGKTFANLSSTGATYKLYQKK